MRFKFMKIKLSCFRIDEDEKSVLKKKKISKIVSNANIEYSPR